MRIFPWTILVGLIFGCKSLPQKEQSELSYQTTPVSLDRAVNYDANRPWLDELDPEVLMALEQKKDHGYTLAELLSQLDWGVFKKRADNRDLNQNSPLYNSLSKELTRLITQHKQQYYVAAQGEYTETSSFQDNPRSFSPKWLTSQHAHYELIGIVNRLDRRDMALGGASSTNCGELRLVYRLAYEVERSRSRLPFTINMVYEARPGNLSCKEYAARFKTPQNFRVLRNYLSWVDQSILTLGKDLSFKQLEVNFQVVRLTSGLKRELGGHAEYIMGVFKKVDKKFVASPLENQPDPKLLSSNPALKAELLDYLSNNLDLLDGGNLRLPEKFLAKEAVSISTHGLARKRNQPYLRIFKAADLAAIDFSQSQTMKTPEAMLARLNDMTCTGCHQGRSVAGFHLFGFEAEKIANPFNKIHVGFSGHFAEERKRRNSYVWRTSVENSEPSGFEKRYLSFQRTKASEGLQNGESCLPSNVVNQHFKGHLKENFSCGSGLSCEVLSNNSAVPIDFGVCVNKASSLAGSACLAGDMDESGRTRLDTMRGNQQVGCQDEGVRYRCLRPFQGTPSGMCISECKNSGQRKPGEICAYNANSNFEACAASNDFASCQNLTGKRSLRQACDKDSHCREDYICQGIFSVAGSPVPLKNRQGKAGFCAPVYFIFQMRLDGHPVHKI